MKRALPWIALAGRWIAGATLAAAGFIKLMAPAEEFAAAMEAYRLFPDALLLPLARVMPWAEYLVGIYLIAGLGLRWTVPAGAVLFGGFVAVLGSALARGLDLSSCGCFGGSSMLPPAGMLAVDSLSVLLLLAAASDREAFFSVDRASGEGEK